MVTCRLFLGPKYDSAQPSYPGFERDVFKTVSDYFYSLPQPVLTYELYELFINVLGKSCGLISSGFFLTMEGLLRGLLLVATVVLQGNVAQTD